MRSLNNLSMCRRCILQANLLLLLLILPGFAESPGDSSKTKNPVNRLVTVVAGDVWHVASAPFRMSGADALKLTTFLAANTGLIYGLDDSADEEFGLESGQTLLRPARGLAELGYLYDDIGTRRIFAGLTAGTFTAGLILRDRKLLETSRLLLEASAITGMITVFNKGLFGRSRPFTNRGARDFNWFKFSNESQYRAMPSGHTSSAFALMTVLALQYDYWYVKLPAYSVAVSVALQRMDDRKHWTSDVVIGGALGYWVSKTLVNRQKNPKDNDGFTPYFSGNKLGVAFHF